MRLLEILSNGNFRLTDNFLDKAIPPYAILSHTWGDANQEVTFEDMVDDSGRNKTGYEKIRFCGEQAAKDGLKHFWVDSCCIKKSSDSELSESITSMFRWYQRAEKCYVYLFDVFKRKRKRGDENLQGACEQAFRRSRWFSRGWTLQELLAPVCVEFFTREGKRLGDKVTLEREINEVTAIPVEAIRGSPMARFGIDERFSWARNRRTTREEDEVYSLLGMFDVSMPSNYGEGRDRAFDRLHDEINKPSKGKRSAISVYIQRDRRSMCSLAAQDSVVYHTLLKPRSTH
jgi:hypothetical protein